MKYLYTLVMMQLKDKIDFSFTKSKQKLIAKIVFTILKFVIVAVIAFGFFFLTSNLKVFSQAGGVPYKVMIVIYGIIFTLSVISCTIGLMKNLYFSEDNKVLITFPVNGNTIFLSKLIIYYITELKRSLFLTIPIFIGFFIVSNVGVEFYIWLFVSFIFLSALPVVVGSLFSIPVMYIFRFLRNIPGLFFVLYLLFVAAIVYGIVKLIGIIPGAINLIQQMGDLQRMMHSIMTWGDRFFYPVNRFVRMICGAFGSYYNLFQWKVWLYFLLTIVSLAVTGLLVFLLARPLFFKMMSKSFEFEKKIMLINKPNKKRGKFRTFLITELKDFIRSDLLSSFMGVYITVPLLIYLINTVFSAIATRDDGKIMIYSFNILLIILPMLASNALISTMYSRGGRAAYVTKTMPLNPVLPLTIKLIPLIIASSISIIISVIAFGRLAEVKKDCIVMIACACVLLQWGHIFWSATLDLMNPQNEQYATTGVMNDNPNEQKSTIIAFILSALYAFFSYILFSEGVKLASIKLLLISVVFMLVCVYLYVVKINIYYSEK